MAAGTYSSGLVLRPGESARLADLFPGQSFAGCPKGHSIHFTIGSMVVAGEELEFVADGAHEIDTHVAPSKEIYFLLNADPPDEIRSVELTCQDHALVLTHCDVPVDQVVLTSVEIKPNL